MFQLVVLFIEILGLSSLAQASPTLPSFPLCDPETAPAFSSNRASEPLSPQFCSKWNPAYPFNGRQCCAQIPRHRRRSKIKAGCWTGRPRVNYCNDMTAEQIEYTQLASSGKLGDLLAHLTTEMGKRGEQAFCGSGNGFLAYGRRLIPTADNRIYIQLPERCLDFGTDAMIGMLEWLGREVGSRYSNPSFSGVRLVIGNISAPRGGLICGRTGRKAHVSHTAGQDVDIAFLSANEGRESPSMFQRRFDVKTNWWMIKRIFKNPFACIKAIFLDRRHIRALSAYAQQDPEWKNYRRMIRHIAGHKNHIHVRIGSAPGLPGCGFISDPELDLIEEEEGIDQVLLSTDLESPSQASNI